MPNFCNANYLSLQNTNPDFSSGRWPDVRTRSNSTLVLLSSDVRQKDMIISMGELMKDSHDMVLTLIACTGTHTRTKFYLYLYSQFCVCTKSLL